MTWPRWLRWLFPSAPPPRSRRERRPPPTLVRDAPEEQVFVTVRLPGAIEPEERHERFGDPLHDALEAQGLGAVSGGGTTFGEGDAGVVAADLDVDVASVRHLSAALVRTRATLVAIGAPITTEIRYTVAGVDHVDRWTGARWDVAGERRRAENATDTSRTRALHTFRFGGEVFGDSVSCLGSHVAALVDAVAGVRADLAWYAADVQHPAFPGRPESTTPAAVGDAATLRAACAAIRQLDSGAFVAVPRDVTAPVFRAGGLHTEDAEGEDLCDTVVELRAFDSCAVEVSTRDGAIAAKLRETFPDRTPGR